MPKSKGLPTRKQILDFIETSDQPAGKREISRAFGLKGQEKIKLKAMLKDMADEGLIDSERGRAFHKMGGVPKVTVLRIVETEGRDVYAVPEKWEAEGSPPPRLRVVEKKGKSALGVGDRILARTEEAGKGWRAHVMKKLARGHEEVMGVLEKGDNDRFWLRPLEKGARRDWAVSDAGEGEPGDLVLAELSGRGAQTRARIIERLGDPFAPRSFSLIAIHKYGIPNVMPQEAIAEAQTVSDLPLATDKREDLRHLPIIAIDPADARDHDDALWAAPDDDPSNQGGFQALVAIADVAYYVRPGSELDREAKRRGNSVYFPDRVVPMLPHELSSDKCSLKAGEDRAALVCHLRLDKNGQVKNWRFSRALVRLAANIAYEDAQAAIDGEKRHDLTDSSLKPLWAAWKALFSARKERAPLELDLPEKQIRLDADGNVTGVVERERLDAHRLVEDFMIAANVAAAKALEAKKSPLIYRVHEPPSREKLVALKEYLKTLEIDFALGQITVPGMFNRLIERIDDELMLPQVMEQILRTQTQAYYTPANAGHFGLALGSYAHFTSPIRRYADLVVHRALVSACKLEDLPPPRSIDIPTQSGLGGADEKELEGIAEAISITERRAMEAERETVDRYVAAYLSTHVGQIVETRITGVQNFGFFATVEGLGGDGLVPVSSLGDDYYRYDEGSKALIGDDSGRRFEHGQRLKLRLAEANPITGGLRFTLPETPDADRDNRGGGRKRSREQILRAAQGKRGRPKNIRHKGGGRGRK